jgi:hypothetical protein
MSRKLNSTRIELNNQKLDSMLFKTHYNFTIMLPFPCIKLIRSIVIQFKLEMFTFIDNKKLSIITNSSKKCKDGNEKNKVNIIT